MNKVATPPANNRRHLAISLSLVLTAWLLIALLQTLHARGPSLAAAPSADFGYGFNVAHWDIDRLQAMGFNWMKVFNNPNGPLPVNILLRVEATKVEYDDLGAFGSQVRQMAQSQKGYVHAYEIGNEPNLDASYGWSAAPNAAHYAALLCRAYNEIKAVDPDAIVVSAGLAPTGRVSGNWNGHPGHNGLYQDEREFFKEFVAAGGANCLDVVGYHPYGFSADYDAEPDVYSADSTQNCVNGFCFRGVEKIYQLMQSLGIGHKQIWATEFGWIITPTPECLEDGSWDGRLWQVVSPEKQASNLVGAFQYATDNWPWMGAMFIFNLNFHTTAPLPPCEQMNFYGVQDRPAEAALRDMPKVTAPPLGELAVTPGALALMITAGQQPYTWTTPLKLSNIGELPFTYTVTVQSAALSPTLDGGSGTLDPGQQDQATVTILSTSRPTGTYTTTLVVTATTGTLGVPLTIPVTLYIVDEIYPAFLPIVTRLD